MRLEVVWLLPRQLFSERLCRRVVRLVRLKRDQGSRHAIGVGIRLQRLAKHLGSFIEHLRFSIGNGQIDIRAFVAPRVAKQPDRTLVIASCDESSC